METIKRLDFDGVGTFYAYEGGELREIPRDEINERLRFERQEDGTLVAVQTLDTPVGLLDYDEIFIRTCNEQLLAPARLMEAGQVKLRVRTTDKESVCRILINGVNPHLNAKYWHVNGFGVVQSSFDVWTGETFVFDYGREEFVCGSPNKRIYDNEREAEFCNTAFGGQSMSERLAFDSVAESEIRDAVRNLRNVMAKHDARIIYNQDYGDLLFTKATPPDGWNVFNDCTDADFNRPWFMIPDSSYRDFGLGDCSYFHFDLKEYLVKKEDGNAQR